MYKVNTLHLIEGAKQAEGLTVIIDVFRAFSLECYLYDMGVKEIRPVKTIEEAFSLGSRIQDSLLVGERQGKKCAGFDYGNSPSSILKEHVAGKRLYIQPTREPKELLMRQEQAKSLRAAW